jgi:hypothetical protein
MRPYIEELINDINEAVEEADKDQEEKKKNGQDTVIQKLCQAKEYHYGNPRRIEKIVGIPWAAFPQDEKLNSQEKAGLARAMEKLLQAWGFYPDFPPRLPFHERYKKLREIWKKEQVYIGTGVNYIDVCEFKESTCAFSSYCHMCDLIREQEKLYNQLMQKRNK